MKTRKRINIIDLLVVVVAVVAIAVLGVSKLVGGSTSEGENKKMRITFYSEEVSDSIADAMKDGDIVSDSITEAVFGEGKIETDDSVSYIATNKADGDMQTGESTEQYKYVKTTRGGYKSVTITCDTQGIYSDIGAVFDDYIYGVGHTLTLLVGDSRITARVRDVEVLED